MCVEPPGVREHVRGDGDRGWEGEGRGRGDTSGSRKGRGRGALLCEKVGRPPPLKPPCLRGRECRKPGSAPDTGGAGRSAGLCGRGSLAPDSTPARTSSPTHPEPHIAFPGNGDLKQA